LQVQVFESVKDLAYYQSFAAASPLSSTTKIVSLSLYNSTSRLWRAWKIPDRRRSDGRDKDRLKERDVNIRRNA
jgi:hypothetical protein